MELKKYKEKNHKPVGILLFTLACVFLIVGVILYQTYAIYEVTKDKDVLNGNVEDPGDIYFAFYVDGTLQKEMPTKNYVLDEKNSFCGVNGKKDEKIKVTLTDEYGIYVTGVTTSRTKCNLYFVKGAFILGKPIKAVTSGEGLYEVTHEGVSETLNDDGFKETEFRYAGRGYDSTKPDEPYVHNYVTFNDEPWRIIGLVNVMTSENQVEQRVKIIRDDIIGNYSWDNKPPNVGSSVSITGSNDWTDSTLMKMLNEDTYWSRANGTCPFSSNGKTTPCDFSGNGMQDKYKQYIETVFWNIGGTHHYLVAYPPAPEGYKVERGTTVYDKRPTLWKNGKIALMYPSDIGFATSERKCDTIPLLNWTEECAKNDWLDGTNENGYWTLTPSIDTADIAFIWFSLVRAVSVDNRTFYPRGVKPVLYLKSNVKIISGDGTSSNPFNLSQILQ